MRTIVGLLSAVEGFYPQLLFCCFSPSLYYPIFPQEHPAPKRKVKIRTSAEVQPRNLLESRVTRPQNKSHLKGLNLKQQVHLSSATLLQLIPEPSVSPQVSAQPLMTSVLQVNMWRPLVAQVKSFSQVDVKP